MPARKKGSRKSGRKYGQAASKRVESAMRRKKRGTLKSGRGGKGGTVKSRKQAIALGGSEKGSQGSQDKGRVRNRAKHVQRKSRDARPRRQSVPARKSHAMSESSRPPAVSGEKLGMPALVFDLDGTLVDSVYEMLRRGAMR